MRNLTIAVLLLTIIGCNEPEEEFEYVVTAQGYRVAFVDGGSVSTGRFSLEQIHALHEEAVESAVASDPNLASAARTVAYMIYDQHSFLVGSTWATGVYWPQANRIDLALWSQAADYAVPATPEVPTWTLRMSWRDPALYVWGVGPPWCPAVGHELGHVLYGPQWGH